MGRIRSKLIKRTSYKLVKIYGDKFINNFEKNKEELRDVADIPSKKLRNLVAGHLTKVMNKKGKKKKKKINKGVKNDRKYDRKIKR